MAFPNLGREISHGSNREQGEAKRLWLPLGFLSVFLWLPDEDAAKGRCQKSKLDTPARSIHLAKDSGIKPADIDAHINICTHTHNSIARATFRRRLTRARNHDHPPPDAFEDSPAICSNVSPGNIFKAGKTARRPREDRGKTRGDRRIAARLREDYGKTAG